jgi:DNA modification methylase
MAETFRNRIVGNGTESPDQLLANPFNFRIHPRHQEEALEGVLNQVGWVQNIIVNKQTGHVIDGHLRVALALRRNEPEVPVLYVDVDEAEEKLILATIDPLSALAVTDAAQLDALLQDVNSDSPAIQKMLSDLAADNGLYFGEQGEPPGDPGAQIDRAEELLAKWQVERGQLWVIPSKTGNGEHRLLCGDSTNADDVTRVTEGQSISLVVTDPPYGVEYADKNKFLNAIAPGNRIQTPIANDHGNKNDIQQMWKSAFEQMSAVMKPGAVVYCFMPQGGDQMMMMMMMMMGAGIEPRHELIWLKNNHVLGRVDYAYKHEPILYAWKDGGHKFYGDFQTSIIECNKPLKSDLHPTMKPVELIERLISNSSLRGENVYDMFGGSGTTLVACEQLGRQGRGLEIEPKYVAVILERMAGMGLEPRLSDS